MPKLKNLQKKFKDVLASGMLTNFKYVKEFEDKCSDFLDVENAVAVSSGTSALLLAMMVIELKGEVILPSFTFSSTGHAALLLGLKPVFADIDEKTLNIDPESIEKKITKKTSAILATHVFGNPCDILAIQKIAKKHNLKVIFDAAHAFGSTYQDKSVAKFGDASCFSFTPTKVISTAEGGLITTNDKILAHKMVIGRNNGDYFDREKEFLGISARMSEFSAILGIESLKTFKENLKKRFRIINFYKKELAKVPGISFQEIRKGNFSVYKDFVVLVDPKAYGKSRDSLMQYLKDNKVECKVYFFPSLHKKKVYRDLTKTDLPKTDFIADRILSLPLYSAMSISEAKEVCRLIKEYAIKK